MEVGSAWSPAIGAGVITSEQSPRPDVSAGTRTRTRRCAPARHLRSTSRRHRGVTPYAPRVHGGEAAVPAPAASPGPTGHPGNPGRASRKARGADAEVVHRLEEVKGPPEPARAAAFRRVPARAPVPLHPARRPRARPRPEGWKGVGHQVRPAAERAARRCQPGGRSAEPRAGVRVTTQQSPGALLRSSRLPGAGPSVTAGRARSYSRSSAAPTAQPRRGRPAPRSADVVRSRRSCGLRRPRGVPCAARLRLRLRRASARDPGEAGLAPRRRAPPPLPPLRARPAPRSASRSLALASYPRRARLPGVPRPSPAGPAPPSLAAAAATNGLRPPAPRGPGGPLTWDAAPSPRQACVAVVVGVGGGGARRGGRDLATGDVPENGRSLNAALMGVGFCLRSMAFSFSPWEALNFFETHQLDG